MGWQTLSLPIMPETFNGLANSDLPKRSETFNGLANSDLPIMPETFEKKSMPEGICRIGIRQPIAILCLCRPHSCFFFRKIWDKIISIYGL